MQGPCFYINNFRASTVTIATTTNNDIDQHEPAEKGAECQVSDHSSIGSEVGEGLSVWGGYLWWMPMRHLNRYLTPCSAVSGACLLV